MTGDVDYGPRRQYGFFIGQLRGDATRNWNTGGARLP